MITDQLAPVHVKGDIFLGRVEEQWRFSGALLELLDPPVGDDLPYVFLLYGDGGMGKTTLAKRFRTIARDERPFKGRFQILWVDWEDERQRHASLRVGREHVGPEAVFDVLHTVAIREKWGEHFGPYQRMVKQRGEAEKKAAEVLAAGGERDEFADVRRAGAGAIAHIIRMSLPVGETGEKLAQAFLEAGIKVGAEQAAELRTKIETRLRASLNPEQFAVFLNPHEQLARALAEGLNRVAEASPLLAFLDTYEIVDRADPWLRLAMKAAGPRVLWVIAGRNDLVQNRQFGPKPSDYFKGYPADFPRRLLPCKLTQLSTDDLCRYFAAKASDRPLADAEAEAIGRATRGIPLAIAAAADLWRAGQPLAEIVGDLTEATPRRDIVSKMTARYLLHVVAEADKEALFALALARGDVDVLHTMLHPANEGAFDLDARLRQLEHDYASVHAERARLHDEPALFFRAHLKDPVRRAEDRVRALNRRAVDVLRQRLARLEADLPLIEDRCANDDWVKAVLDLTDFEFWLDEDEAWKWLTPRFVESLAHSRELRRGLLRAANEWKDHLSQTGQQGLKALRPADDVSPAPEEEADLLDELARLESLGWLRGKGEAERRAILDWRRGQLLYHRKKYAEALTLYERVEQGWPETGATLKKKVVDALYDVSNKIIWPDDARSSVPTEVGLRASQLTIILDPTNGSANYNYAVALADLGEKEKAIDYYQRAIAIEERVTRYNGLGNVYRDLGRYDEALAAYKRATELDPKDATPHNGLGNVYRDLGRPDDAIVAYQRD
jgi:tetratricopeptide (TPR) repeat protein